MPRPRAALWAAAFQVLPQVRSQQSSLLPVTTERGADLRCFRPNSAGRRKLIQNNAHLQLPVCQTHLPGRVSVPAGSPRVGLPESVTEWAIMGQRGITHRGGASGRLPDTEDGRARGREGGTGPRPGGPRHTAALGPFLGTRHPHRTGPSLLLACFWSESSCKNP